MQVSVAGLRRNIKNIAHNYTEPQKKVREATSNDPWGPSSTLMSEIADLTYNIEAFSQIMEMLWKRLNDHGKNWRHVYKSLVLLEYLIKTGSERVASQCKENIFAIQTLKDFQYLEENKDQGLNVREKAKQLVTLLSSEERLRNERARALKARERFAQTVSGFGSTDSNDTTPTSPVFSSHGFSGAGGDMNGHFAHGHGHRHRTHSELEQARPQTVGEEELQLQLALAMSKEEADQEEKRRRSDDLRLQMALSQSEQEFGGPIPKKDKDGASALVDLMGVDMGNPIIAGAASAVMTAAVGADPWAPIRDSMPVGATAADPWSGSSSTVTSPQDPWGGAGAVGGAAAIADPWATPPASGASSAPPDPWLPSAASAAKPLEEDEFDCLSKRPLGAVGDSVFSMDRMESSLLQPMSAGLNRSSNASPTGRKNPSEFLGENSALVNLDNLVPSSTNSSSSFAQQNPFMGVSSSGNSGSSLLSTGMGSTTVNPFQAQSAASKPSMNEMREQQQQQLMGNLNIKPASSAQNNPWSPVKADNPFLQ